MSSSDEGKILVRLLLLGIVLLVAGLIVVSMNRGYFIANRVRYYLNQQKFREAGEIMMRLDSGSEKDRTRFQALRVQLDTLEGRVFDSVKLASESLTQHPAQVSPRLCYWGAISAFQAGENDLSRQLAEKIPSDKDELGNPMRQVLVRAMAGGKFELKERWDDSDPRFASLFNLEKAQFYAFRGLDLYHEGDYHQAHQLLKKAIWLGSSPSGVFFAMSVCDALENDLNHAQMYLDYLEKDAPREMFKKLYDEWKSRSGPVDLVFSIPDADEEGSRHARAAAWAASRCIASEPSSRSFTGLRALESLQKAYPQDAAISMRTAEAFETLGRWRDAYDLYQQVYNRWPNFELTFRIENTSGEHKKWQDIRNNYVRRMNLSGNWGAKDMQTSGGKILHGDVMALYTNGNVEVTTSSEFSRDYRMLIVARCDRAFWLSPVLTVKVNGRSVGTVYIPRESWECYAVDVPLTSGVNHVSLEYENDSARVLDRTEDRNVYLKKILLIEQGAERL